MSIEIGAFISKNYEWLFSGAGVAIVIFFLTKNKKSETNNIPIDLTNENDNSSKNTSTSSVVVNLNEKGISPISEKELSSNKLIDKDKCSIKILFIDDDTKFNVINIIKNSGWKNTKIIKDINSIDSYEVTSTDIFFVDIRGVGKKLGFQDEGLGLAKALKTKYPDKKVVIYSAEQRGDRFHEGLRKADDFLAKNAEPFEFQQTIERLCE